MTLQERLEARLRAMQLSGPALVAVSGGPDSIALLDLLSNSAAAARLSIHVAHLDHGIHPESGKVMEAVRRITQRYGFSFLGHRLELGPDASETLARVARYEWLESEADRLGAGTIFLAHHRDDQIETVLMRLLRGSGSAGLAGMAIRRGRIVRPLLGFPRSELERHARGLGVEVWDDPANRDLRHDRVWIRRTVLPLLRERMPDLDRQLLRVARNAARERTAWDRLLDTEVFELQGECDGISVAASPFGDYDSNVVRALLGALGRRVGCHVGPRRAARVEQLLAGGRSGAKAQLGTGCAAELTFGRLRLFREGSQESPSPVPLAGQVGATLLGPWELRWRSEPAPARIERISLATWVSPGAYQVRSWRSGDRIHPLGGSGRRLVVRCMQDVRIARHLRATWPVVEADGTIVWVPGVCRSAGALPAPGGEALRIDAQQR